MMAGWVLGRVLTLPEREVSRFHDDGRAPRSGELVVRIDIVHPHHHRVRYLATPRWSTVKANVADDKPTLAEAQLRPVILPDPHTLDKPECAA